MASANEEEFQRRVAQINAELGDVMSKNAACHEQLTAELRGFGFSSARPPPTWRRSANMAGSDAALYAGSGPTLLTSSDMVAREVHTALAKEMTFFEDKTRELVAREWDARASEIDTVLRSRFSELQVMNDRMGKVLGEMGGAIAATRRECRLGLDELRGWAESQLNDLRREATDGLREGQRELRNLREALLEAQAATRGDGKDLLRRAEDALRRAHESHGEVVALCDSRVDQLREELVQSAREAKTRWVQEFDELARNLFQLRGAASAVEDVAQATQQQVQALLEERAAANSELRQLRSDAQQAELATRRRLDRFKASLGTGAGAGGLSVTDGMRLHQDVYALKQSVAYLASLVEGGAASLRAASRVAAGASSGERSSPPAPAGVPMQPQGDDAVVPRGGGAPAGSGRVGGAKASGDGAASRLPAARSATFPPDSAAARAVAAAAAATAAANSFRASPLKPLSADVSRVKETGSDLDSPARFDSD